jgi:hypothetical protein
MVRVTRMCEESFFAPRPVRLCRVDKPTMPRMFAGGSCGVNGFIIDCGNALAVIGHPLLQSHEPSCKLVAYVCGGPTWMDPDGAWMELR